MKKHIKLERKPLSNYASYRSFIYTPKNGDSELFATALVLETYGSSDLLQFIMEPELESYQAHECLIEKEGNMVELYDDYYTFQPKGDEDMIPSAIITLENLKQLALDWGVLMNKKAPEIYFIRNDDASIIVRESLEES